MKISTIAVLAIATSSVNGAWINSRFANSNAIDNKSMKITTPDSQPINIEPKEDRTAMDGAASDIATTDSDMEAMDPDTDDSKMEIATTAMDSIGSGIESAVESYEYDGESDKPDGGSDESGSAPTTPRKLCPRRLKPRCCEAGGRLYKDGCERRRLFPSILRYSSPNPIPNSNSSKYQQKCSQPAAPNFEAIV
ncbi:hypothetical protein NHQ30_006886 [Ciborinia camelliae]|nr:hypothetical protein NHQ30_006886 [Ciborinia camelliae]